MRLINEFIEQYNKEYDYYQKLAQIISNKIEDQLFTRGIKAIVSFRAKKPERLYDKLIKRDQKKNYKTILEIYQDIVDLAGIRVSLYFPSERELLDEIINEIFDVKLTKVFPDNTHTPKYTKRFSGYWATHYRVQLKDNDLTKRYQNTLAEIQVASVLMHAWSEVEHDLVYKPYSGELSKEELAILDEINGLVLAGEIALERLQSAMALRTENTSVIDDKYEFTNYIVSKFKNDNVKYGNPLLIYNFIKDYKKIDTKVLNEYLSRINIEDKETIYNQLFDIFLNDQSLHGDKEFKDFILSFNIPQSNSNLFEKFIKCWTLLEESASYLISNEEKSDNMKFKYVGRKFEILLKDKKLSEEQYEQIKSLKRLRNDLVHNIASSSLMRSDYDSVKNIAATLISQIDDKMVKERLERKLKSI